MITIGEENLLSVRYETRLESFVHCSYSIMQQNKKPHDSIQIDAINAWLAVREKKRPVKKAVD